MSKLQIEYQTTTIRVVGKPLGRLRLVNWRDVARAMKEETAPVPINSVDHVPNVTEPLAQGNLGACTGFAAAQCASTQPFPRRLTNADAVACYSRATELDAFPGQYPPTDTGSTGWAAMMAATERGWFDGFSMTNGLDAVLSALQTRPLILGLDWYQGCDEPDSRGLVTPTRKIRGGHEVLALAVDDEARVVWCRNSWGRWGIPRNGIWGYFALSYDHLALLLESGGDATAPDLPEGTR